MSVKYFKDGTWKIFPGTTGMPGKNGKDCYEVAKENGYTGTREDYEKLLADLGNLDAKISNLEKETDDSIKSIYDTVKSLENGQKVYVGSTQTKDGESGIVPAPQKSNVDLFLCNNGGWSGVSTIWDGANGDPYQFSDMYDDYNSDDYFRDENYNREIFPLYADSLTGRIISGKKFFGDNTDSNAIYHINNLGDIAATKFQINGNVLVPNQDNSVSSLGLASSSDLAQHKVKTCTISTTAGVANPNAITNAEFNEQTGELTLTKGSISPEEEYVTTSDLNEYTIKTMSINGSGNVVQSVALSNGVLTFNMNTISGGSVSGIDETRCNELIDTKVQSLNLENTYQKRADAIKNVNGVKVNGTSVTIYGTNINLNSNTESGSVSNAILNLMAYRDSSKMKYSKNQSSIDFNNLATGIYWNTIYDTVNNIVDSTVAFAGFAEGTLDADKAPDVCDAIIISQSKINWGKAVGKSVFLEPGINDLTGNNGRFVYCISKIGDTYIINGEKYD